MALSDPIYRHIFYNDWVKPPKIRPHKAGFLKMLAEELPLVSYFTKNLFVLAKFLPFLVFHILFLGSMHLSLCTEITTVLRVSSEGMGKW